jgi:hypothetical protein
MAMVPATAASVTPNSAAMAVRVKTTRKKSKASSVQPRKLASTAAFADPRQEVAAMGSLGRAGENLLFFHGS